MQLIFGKTNFGSWWMIVRLLILLATISASTSNELDVLYPRSPSMSLLKGDACRTLSDEPGICIFIRDCRVYVQALKSKTMKYNSIFRCGFIRTDEVICCPINTASTGNEINPVTRFPPTQPWARETTIHPQTKNTQTNRGVAIDTTTTTRPHLINISDWRLLTDNSIINKPDIIIYEVSSTRSPTIRPQLSSAQLWELFRRATSNVTTTATIRPRTRLPTTQQKINWTQSQGQSRRTTTNIPLHGTSRKVPPQTNRTPNQGQSRGTTAKINLRPQATSRTFRPQINLASNVPQMAPQSTTTATNMRPSHAFCLRTKTLFPTSGDADILRRTEVPVGVFAHIGDLMGMANGEEEFFCQSSLIAERYVLTVADCVADEDSRPTFVRFGKTAWHPENDTVVDYQIKNFTIHSEFKSGSSYDDIAIVELRRPVLFNIYIRPGCLYPHVNDINANVPLTVIGLTQEVMTLYTSTTVNVNTCNDSYKAFGVSRSYIYGIAKGHYCVFSETLKNKNCEVDTGAPLQLIIENEIATVGILSFGKLCGSPLPAVYDRIAFYLDWIERLVWPNGA